MLSPLELGLAALELTVISYVGWRSARSIRLARSKIREGGADAFTAIRSAARETVRIRWASEAVAQEMAMFYYAFFSWRSPPPSEDYGFSSHRKNSYGIFLLAIVIVLVIETFAVHLLVYMFWSKIAAWIFTAISLYTLIWMIADWQSLRLRRTTVTPESIHIKLGTRWEVDIPRKLVDSVGTPEQRVDDQRPLNLVLIGAPDVEIRLSEPVTARGMYGIRRNGACLRLQIDEPDRFIALAGADASRD
jgi:hypothetical protein